MERIRLFRADPHDENVGHGVLVVLPAIGLSRFVNSIDGSKAWVRDVKSLGQILSGPVLEIGAGDEKRLRDRPASTASAAQHQAILVVKEEQENAAVGDRHGVGGCHAIRLSPSYSSSNRGAAPWVTGSLGQGQMRAVGRGRLPLSACTGCIEFVRCAAPCTHVMTCENAAKAFGIRGCRVLGRRTPPGLTCGDGISHTSHEGRGLWKTLSKTQGVDLRRGAQARWSDVMQRSPLGNQSRQRHVPTADQG